MSLQKDTISLNLAKSIQTSTDEKIAGPDQNSELRDARFNEDFALEKRMGLDAQPTTVLTSLSNPLTITTTPLKSFGFAHEQQQCLHNNGALYSQYDSQDKWAFKGHYYPIGVSSTTVKSGVNFSDSVTSSGMTALAGDGYVYLREDSTGNIISVNAVADIQRLVAFSNAIWVIWRSTSTIKAQQISFSTGALSAAVDLNTDMNTASTASRCSVAVTSGGLLGEIAFFTYQTTGGAIKVIPFNSSGVIPALGVRTTGITGVPLSIYINTSDNANKYYISYYVTSGSTIRMTSDSFTAGAYTNVFTTGALISVSTYNPLSLRSIMYATMALDPVSGAGVYLFFSILLANPILELNEGSTTETSVYTNSFDSPLVYAQVNKTSGSTITSATVYGRGYNIAANAVLDTVRDTIYLPCLVYSETQSTYLLVDFLKGRGDTTTWVIGKWLYRLAGLQEAVSQCYQTTSTSDIYRFTNHGNSVDIDFSPDNAAQVQYFAKTTHLTGGLLWAYDGQTLAEHNFLIAPEITESFVGTKGAIVTGIQQGDASHPEIFDISFYSGAMINPNEAEVSSGYIAFSAPSGSPSNWYIWYTVDGWGSDPAPGGRTAIPVAVLSTDTADEVAYKTLLAIESVVSSSQFDYQLSEQDGATPAKLRLTTQNNGSTTNPASNLADITGALSAGAYQYCTVWRWTDRNGQVYRSAPSVPYSLTAAAGDRGGLLIFVPPITNKTYSDVVIEVYRTTANGSQFYLLNELSGANDVGSSNRAVMSNSYSRYSYFYDGLSDAQISTQRILYTNGGVLDNFNIGACSAVTFFKERLTTNYSDDPFAVYYSKQNVVGEPVNFAEELNFRVDAEASPVIGLKMMDDKLCTFKRKLIYAQSGDGANDLGAGSTFSPPLLVASDAGAIDPNAIALYPNGLLFKSEKGIYELTRALSVQYTGVAVQDYNAFYTSSAVLIDESQEVRFTLADSSVGLIYNYLYKRWDTFTNYQADSAWIWQGRYCLVRNSGVVNVESLTNFYDYNGSSNVSYSMFVKTPWLRLKGVQDFQRIYRLSLLGKYETPHTLTIKVYYDYDTSFYDTVTFNGQSLVTGTFPGDNVYQAQVFPTRQKCQSIQIEIYETPISGTQASLKLNELGAVVGLKRGLNKIPARKTS